MRRLHRFYQEVLADLLTRNTLDRQMRILVVAGAGPDRDILRRCGFENVVISNLDTRMNGSELAPFEWSFQDAENLTFEDGSFDFSIVHSGLHHCYSPHRALLEMYRVARKGLLMFEPCDSLLSRVGLLLRVGQEYEHASVNGSHGGVGNSPIPNYVYRWTEREIVKTINSFAPYGKHRFRFYHKTRTPWGQLRRRRYKWSLSLVLVSLPILKILALVFPKQTNNLAAVVLKPDLPADLHPWLVWGEGTIKANKPWLANRYGK